MTRLMLYGLSNTASDNMVSGKYTKGGVTERPISLMYTLNIETKSILSDRALVNFESSSNLSSVFPGFGYKTTEKP